MNGDPLSVAAAELFAPLLKEQGFRKRRLTWNRSEFGFTSVVNVQRSQWGSRDHCVFMVNLAVGFQPEGAGRFLMEYDCPSFLRRRLNDRLPGDYDNAWTIDPNTLEIARVVVGECRDDLEKFGLPWLSNLRLPTQVIATLQDEIARRSARGAKRWIAEAEAAVQRAQKMMRQMDDSKI